MRDRATAVFAAASAVVALHAVADAFLAPERGTAAAAGTPKELWVVAGAGHTGGYERDPRTYEQRVVGFFDRALLQAAAPLP